MNSRDGVRVVAMIEAAKGALVLFVGFGLLEFVHKDAQRLAEDFVRLFHLNPASHIPRIFLALMARADDVSLWLLACTAFSYAALRLAEAVGLWYQRSWALWLGTLSGAIYIPIEIYELVQGVTWFKTILLLLNTLCIVVLVRVLQLRRRRLDA
jgi:uncharacterized membrane protein (DUF2068 family)